MHPGRRWGGAWMLGLIGVAGCGDPQLTLEFDVPEIYRPMVQDVALRIFIPPAAAPFSCRDLAFGRADPEVVGLSQVSEVVLRDGTEIPLADISRTGDKRFVIEGRDAEGRPWVMGCADLGDIESSTALSIEAHPVTQATVTSTSNLAFVNDFGPVTVPVNVTDLRGESLAGVDVLWERETSTAQLSFGEVTTDGEGQAAIVLSRPSASGPFVLDIDVRWAEQPVRVPGFAAPPKIERALAGAVEDYVVGRVGPAGESGVATLVDVGGMKVVQTLYAGPFGGVQGELSPMFFALDARLGLVAQPNLDHDRVLVVDQDVWLEIEPNNAVTDLNFNPPPEAAGLRPGLVLPYGDCEGLTPGLLITYQLGSTLAFTLDGALDADFGGLDFRASGCVSNAQGELRRTYLINSLELGLVLAYEGQENTFILPWVALASGVAFPPPLANGRRVVLGTQVEVNNFIISRATWQEEDGDVTLIVEGIDDPPRFPLANRGGDLNSDRMLDVVSLFEGEPPSDLAVGVVSSRRRRGVRISGLFDRVGEALADPALEVVDVDGDGQDDVLLIERGVSGGRSESIVEIYLMGQ